MMTYSSSQQLIAVANNDPWIDDDIRINDDVWVHSEHVKPSNELVEGKAS